MTDNSQSAATVKSGITFERIDVKSDAILRNLYEHYVHDMSEWLGIEVRADGRFAFDTSPLWSRDTAVYFAKLGEQLAGFCVAISAEKWTGNPAARDVKDFFVLRAHRHAGVADAMAKHLFSQFSTQRVVRVLITNKPALPFWRRAVRKHGRNARRTHCGRQRPAVDSSAIRQLAWPRVGPASTSACAAERQIDRSCRAASDQIPPSCDRPLDS
jgi:predicted acetyltransferase